MRVRLIRWGKKSNKFFRIYLVTQRRKIKLGYFNSLTKDSNINLDGINNSSIKFSSSILKIIKNVKKKN